MGSNKKFFFSCSSLLPTSSNNTFKVKKHWQRLIILKNHLNHPLNIVILKNLACCKIFCKSFFFFWQIYLKEIYYIAQGFLNLLKFLVRSVLLLKWNNCSIASAAVKIFVSLVKLLNISLDEYSIFLSHVK